MADLLKCVPTFRRTEGHPQDTEVAMTKDLLPGRRVLHVPSGRYGVIAMAWALPVGYSWVYFDGENKTVEIYQGELTPL